MAQPLVLIAVHVPGVMGESQPVEGVLPLAQLGARRFDLGPPAPAALHEGRVAGGEISEQVLGLLGQAAYEFPDAPLELGRLDTDAALLAAALHGPRSGPCGFHLGSGIVAIKGMLPQIGSERRSLHHRLSSVACRLSPIAHRCGTMASMTEYRLTVREWPQTERPREKLERHGAAALSTAELLAIILRTGTVREDVVALSQRLLVQKGGLGGLATTSMTELVAEHGLGLAKAAQLKAALELGRRLMVLMADPTAARVQVRSPGDVANLLMIEMGLLEQEVMRTVLLNTKNHVIATPVIYQGSAHTAVIRVGELFREAVKHNAVSLIVVHNHPSGDPTPSPEDVAVTRAIVAAGKLLDIEVLDHLVIGHQRFVSLKERGLGFGP
jgi:DNA repair protein RadC